MDWMAEAIHARGGAVTFRDFMELALYDPGHGYYSSIEVRYGRDGDFLTAPTASAWYARVLGRLVRGLRALLGSITVIDVAAGDGSFLAELALAVSGDSSTGLGELWAVERSAARRASIAARLPAARVAAGLEELPDLSGQRTVLHACELYDAFPVHRVEGGPSGPFEQWVVVRDGALGLELRPPLPAVGAYLERHAVELAEGQVAELNLAARPFHRRLLECAGEGLALVLDYGYESHRLYRPRGRRGGSLATYRRHRLGRDPLESPGEVDLTAHVNWDDLRLAAADAGWCEIALWPLAELLVRAGIADELDERGLGMAADLDAATVTARQEVKRLLDPEGMGSDLKVLVQARGPLAGIAADLLADR